MDSTSVQVLEDTWNELEDLCEEREEEGPYFWGDLCIKCETNYKDALDTNMLQDYKGMGRKAHFADGKRWEKVLASLTTGKFKEYELYLEEEGYWYVDTKTSSLTAPRSGNGKELVGYGHPLKLLRNYFGLEASFSTAKYNPADPSAWPEDQ